MNIPRIGDEGHVRHYEWWQLISKLIHCALNKWHKEWCQRVGLPYREVKGSHDFIIVKCPESKYGVGAGESLARSGTVITPWEKYLEEAAAGNCEVWIFDAGLSDQEREEVNAEWLLKCFGKPYDWAGIAAILMKVLTANFSDRMRDWKWAEWCTESAGIAYRAIHRDVFQVDHPTPLTTEQVCGWLSRKPGVKTTLTLRFHIGLDRAAAMRQPHALPLQTRFPCPYILP